MDRLIIILLLLIFILIIRIRSKDNQQINSLISSQTRKLNAASIEVLRQADYKDWQLYLSYLRNANLIVLLFFMKQ